MLHTICSAIGQPHVAAVLVGAKIAAGDQCIGQRGHPAGQRLGFDTAAGDHQRDARLVDEDRIGFIDQRRAEGREHEMLRVQHQLIAQKIESDFVGGRVGHVA